MDQLDPLVIFFMLIVASILVFGAWVIYIDYKNAKKQAKEHKKHARERS